MSNTHIRVPQSATVYIVEDSEKRLDWFRQKLGARIIRIDDKPELSIDWMKGLTDDEFNAIDLFFLDHDLGGAAYASPYATDIAKYMVQRNPRIGFRTVIHSQNPYGSEYLAKLLPGSMRMPFGSFDIIDKVS